LAPEVEEESEIEVAADVFSAGIVFGKLLVPHLEKSYQTSIFGNPYSSFKDLNNYLAKLLAGR
jgi:hypothetical protein